MIAYIKGKVISYDKDSAIIDNHGIGYKIYMPKVEKLVLQQDVLVYTYQQFREDGQSLFGFLTKEDEDLFLKLINVKGIGAKTALNALNTLSTSTIVNAIENGDTAMLKKLPGIGAKAASQIILDLKGKLVEHSEEVKVINQNLQDAIDGLKNLGYKQNEIHSIMKELNKEKDLTTDAYIRKALALLLKKKGV